MTDERVPVCGTNGTMTVSRAIWDEAWLAYSRKYGADRRQHDRLLAEGFYAEELDQDRPGWRPVEQELQRLKAEIAMLRAELEQARARLEECHKTRNDCINALAGGVKQ